MAGVIEFDISLRGYDRLQVEAVVKEVVAAAGDRGAIVAAVAAARPFTECLRGYDMAQVNGWLDRAAAGGVVAPESWVPAPTLEVLVRGYRVAETDALLATVQAGLEQDDPFRRADALRAIDETKLPVGWRGYAREPVDNYLQRAAKVLGR